MEFTAEVFAELERADAARAAGNEGRARVCARRAAGMAAREFLSRYAIHPASTGQRGTRSSSAYEALQTLAAFPGLASHLKQAAVNLTMRVTDEFVLPVKVDLIAEARKLVAGL